MAERLEAVEGNLLVLEQAVEVLRRMEDAIYADGGAAVGISPVGVHFRHVLDHYRAFLSGTRRRPDRLRRPRPPGPPGAGPRARRRHRPRFHRRLSAGSPASSAARPIEVTVRSVAGDEVGPDWSSSSIKRELQFLVSHTVHHYALIKELLRRAGFEAGDEFGVAPSTLAAVRRDPACVR